MIATKTRLGLTLLLLSALLLMAACGGPLCEGSIEEPSMAVAPSTVSAGEETNLMTTFERDVLVGGRVNVRDVRGMIEDSEGARIGWFSLTEGFDGEQDLDVSGAILDAMVIDARSVELTAELPPSTSGETLQVRILADDGGVECGNLDIGTAELEVL